MTDAELGVIVRALAPVVRDVIAKSMAVANVKIAVLEAREALHGRDGLPGVPGQSGERGPAGEPGPTGASGHDGAPGPVGPQGEIGPVGPIGEAGSAGTNGQDGQSGADGAPGQPGERGEKGIDGLHGKDGRDGVTLDMSDFVSLTSDDDGRTLSFTFKRGDVEVRQQVKTSLVLDRGVYTAGKTYEAGDGVTWGGSFWIAKAETDTQPDTNAGASAWRLAVKRGREGKAGKPGPEGPQGQSGRDGLDLTRTDGFGRKA